MPSSKAELNLVRSSLLHVTPQRSGARGALQARAMHVAVGVSPHAAGSARAVRAGTEAMGVLTAEVVDAGQGCWEIDCDSANSISAPSHLPHLLRTLLLSTLPPLPPPLQPATPQSAGRAWSLHLDLRLRSNVGGNAADALLAAAWGAVFSARLPMTRQVGATVRLEQQQGETNVEGQTDGLRIGQGPRAAANGNGAVDFELLQGEFKLPNLEQWPVAVTVALLPNGTHLLDPSAVEEAAIPPHCRLLVLAGADGRVRGARLLAEPEEGESGEADLTKDQTEAGGATWGALPLSRVTEAIKLGAQYAAQLHAALYAQLDDE